MHSLDVRYEVEGSCRRAGACEAFGAIMTFSGDMAIYVCISVQHSVAYDIGNFILLYSSAERNMDRVEGDRALSTVEKISAGTELH
jgi:hypothetical protein